jgi:HTH-type transcriptional regulator/antitoxin HigA
METKMEKEKKPFMNIGTGAFIQEELDERNWRQEDLAEILNMSLKSVNLLIKNKQAITVKTAKLLGKAFGQSPQYWLNLDSNYRLRLSNYTELEARTDLFARIYKYMPVKEMIEKKWIESYDDADELRSLVCKFWEIRKLDFKFLEGIEVPTLKRSGAFAQFNKYFALTWFNMAQKCAEVYSVDKYSKKKLRKITSDFAKYTIYKAGPRKLISDLNCAGVKFLVLQHLKKTYIDGAAFRDDANPVIVCTLRYDRVDNFWFTAAHEIAHVLLHLKSRNDYFIDNIDQVNTSKEQEANDFALKIIKANEVIEYFHGFGSYISEKRVRGCAQKLGVSEAIVVGVLQYNKILSRKNLNWMKGSITDKIPRKYWAERHLRKVRVTPS